MWFVLLAILVGPCRQVWGSNRMVKLALTKSNRRNDTAMDLLIKNFKLGQGKRFNKTSASAARLENKLAHVTSLTRNGLQTAKQYRETLVNVEDVFYSLEVQIGTPAVSARLIFDTGSSDTWLKTSPYKVTKSSTALLEGNDTIQVEYGKGEMEGRQASDRLCLNSAENDPDGSLCLDQMGFIAAEHVKDMGNDGLFDGLLGAGFPELEVAKQTTFLEQLSKQGSFKQLAFGLSLSSTLKGSSVTFGELDDLIQEAPKGASSIKLPVVEIDSTPYFWMVRADLTYQFQLSTPELLGHKYGFQTPVQKPVITIFDSGTSFISMSSDFYDDFVAYIIPDESNCGEDQGIQVCPCDTELRPFTLTFNGDDQQSLKVELDKDDLFLDVGAEYGVEYCALQIMSTSAKELPANIIILGDTFLKTVYAVHDMNTPQVILFQKLENKTSIITSAIVHPNGLSLRLETVLLSMVAVLGLLAGGVFWYRWRQRTHASRVFVNIPEDVNEAQYINF